MAEGLIEFSDWPRDVDGAEGASASFVCRVAEGGEKVEEIQWMQNGTLLEKESSSSLVLRNLDYSHQGTYQCAVSIAGGTVLSCPGTLRLISAPHLSLHPQDSSVRIGDTARFQCSVRAIPPAFVAWLHNDLPLTDIRNSR